MTNARRTVFPNLPATSIIEVLKEDYVRTARAKGIKEKVVIWKHAFRNSMISVVTVVGLQFGFLLGGSVVTETVFAYPGLGSLLIESSFKTSIMEDLVNRAITAAIPTPSVMDGIIRLFRLVPLVVGRIRSFTANSIISRKPIQNEGSEIPETAIVIPV